MIKYLLLLTISFVSAHEVDTQRHNDHVEKLSFYNQPLTNIDFIGFFPNLTELDLEGCGLGDSYHLIRSLTHLRILNLSLNGITTTHPLRELNLGLVFNDDSITYPPLDFISPITKLRVLILCSNNYIFDLTPISLLPRLKILDVTFLINVSDFTPLQQLTTLEQLEINNE